MDKKIGIIMSIIPDTVKIYGDVRIGQGCVIGEFSIIGYPYIESKKSFNSRNIKTSIGDRSIIGSHVVIYSGAQIGDKTRIEDFCRIGKSVIIGKRCRILYGAKIYDEVIIGENCIIGGFCCERANIKNDVRLFGELLHSHREPHLGWDDITEESPIIEDRVFIGFEAKIIGGVKIQKNSYIAAGAIVTKDVPPKSIVTGVNNIFPYTEWKGKLRQSKFFKRVK